MPTIEDALKAELTALMPPIFVASVVRSLPESRLAQAGTLDLARAHELLAATLTGVRLFSVAPPMNYAVRLQLCITGGRASAPVRTVISIRTDHDVLAAQSTTQRMLKGLFKATDCVRITTAVSELSRNIYMYAGTGQVTLELAEDPPGTALFSVVAEDRGGGIKGLDTILDGTYRSKTGLGRGLRGAKSLLDDLHVKTGPDGTTVRGHRRTRLSLPM